jgi:hypothetical protein
MSTGEGEWGRLGGFGGFTFGLVVKPPSVRSKKPPGAAQRPCIPLVLATGDEMVTVHTLTGQRQPQRSNALQEVETVRRHGLKKMRKS